MDYNAVWMFIRVVQAGGFSAAARLLGVPKSTVSKRVSELERQLKTTLLQRTTRKLSLTDAGRLFFESCSRAFSEIQDAETSASVSLTEPAGLLRITAPAEMTSDFVIFINKFMTEFPKIEVDLLLTDRMVDLIAERVDVALRAGDLEDSTLIAKRIGASRFHLVASPGYLKANGTPKTPQDLTKHSCLKYHPDGDEATWQLHSGQRRTRVNVAGSFSSTSLTAVKTMALCGRGIALLPTLSTRDEITAGHLSQVLHDWSTGEGSIHIVYPRQKFLPARTRAFLDFTSVHFTAF